MAATHSAAPFDFPGDRRGVLLLHGFTGSPWEVRPLGERLAQRGMTVVGPIVPGHGTGPRDLAETPWRDWEAGASAALDALRARCDRVAIAGLSMGGLLALRLAWLRPEEVRAIALLAVPLFLPRPIRRAVHLLSRVGVPWAVPKIGGSDVRDPRMRAENPGYRMFPVRGVAQLMELQGDIEPLLPQIRTPTLILHGRNDHTAPPIGAREMARRLPDVRLRWLPRSYHLLPVDVERDRVAELVGDFVEEYLS